MPRKRYVADMIGARKKNLSVIAVKNVPGQAFVMHHIERVVGDVEERVVTCVHENQISSGDSDKLIALGFSELHQGSGIPLQLREICCVVCPEGHRKTHVSYKVSRLRDISFEDLGAKINAYEHIRAIKGECKNRSNN